MLQKKEPFRSEGKNRRPLCCQGRAIGGKRKTQPVEKTKDSKAPDRINPAEKRFF